MKESIRLVLAYVGLVGCIAALFGLVMLVADVVEVYFKFRKHLFRGDFFKGKDRE